MEDTIFAKIIRKEIPADIVYEDENTLAFLDIHPANAGHTLVVPKKYFKNVYDIDLPTWLALMTTVHKLVPAIQKATNADGMNIVMNNEESAGQIIFHAHIHIIPRMENDGHVSWPRHEYKEGEAIEVLSKIKNNLEK